MYSLIVEVACHLRVTQVILITNLLMGNNFTHCIGSSAPGSQDLGKGQCPLPSTKQLVVTPLTVVAEAVSWTLEAGAIMVNQYLALARAT